MHCCRVQAAYIGVDNLKKPALQGFQCIGSIAELVEGDLGICKVISDSCRQLLGKSKCVGGLIVALVLPGGENMKRCRLGLILVLLLFLPCQDRDIKAAV